MIVTVASGKGGTGKTTVTASLVSIWETKVLAVDLDVEEPNLHLFLNPTIEDHSTAELEIPILNLSQCNLCGKCVELCQFKAISLMGKFLMTFPDMCHGCGGCLAICPEKALTSGKRELGEIHRGHSGDADFIMGRIRIGEAMTPPLMNQVKQEIREKIKEDPMDVLMDAPPGVSCPAVTSVLDSDVIVLVTDSTPFGFHDFALAWEAFSPLGKPMGVVINRAGLGNNAIHEFCREKQLPVLAEIPYDRAIAEAYSRGQIVADVSDSLHELFVSLQQKIQDLAAGRLQEVSHA
jgi:MinD superfamily P-loop ATPase